MFSISEKMDTGTGLRLISIGLHAVVSEIVGYEKFIDIRRNVTNLKNDFLKLRSENSTAPIYGYLSGSKGEGFRFSSSDDDYMFIYNNVRVIQSMSQCRLYDVNTALLLMETEQTSPGFVLLRLIGNTHNYNIRRSCLQYPQGIYVSSQKWRDGFPRNNLSETIHGPCSSGVIAQQEYDFAHCLKSDTFPKAAIGCIRRLHDRCWPSTQVLKDIITGGCYFVAIPAKLSNFEQLEWRLSFSAAETKLIHSMNHTQFLCYGILKIFLKEAINTNKDVEGLLCSYYLKTAVFWEIMDARQEWNPSTFLKCFWRCLKRLIQWVNEEFCPNFFIPENNMMMGKFNGTTKAALLHHLSTLYSEGYRCLLRCPSLHDTLSIIIHMPIIMAVLPTEEDFTTKVLTDLETIKEMADPGSNLDMILTMKDVEQLNILMERCSNEQQLLVLYAWKSKFLCYLYLLFVSKITEDKTLNNKTFTTLHANILNSMQKYYVNPAYTNSVIAVGMYKQGRYKVVIKAVDKIRAKLQNPHMMYPWTLDEYRYRAADGENTPLITMMRKVLASPIALRTNSHLSELALEHQESAKQIGSNFIIFPPVIISNFLLFLSQFHMRCHEKATEALGDLFIIVHYDEGYHIQEILKAISWEILGICQEMMGDYQGAYQSFTTGLQQPDNFFRGATLMRLLIILYKLQGSL